MRRRLAYYYAELTRREVEYVAITRDTTEADLKQRREILNGSAWHANQPPVRAALEGRILVLDGLEKAERNVLPTLNNLLENREMALDDGSFLMSGARYEQLIAEGASDEELRRKRILKVRLSLLPPPLCLPSTDLPSFYT
jgi:hypothetical protein